METFYQIYHTIIIVTLFAQELTFSCLFHIEGASQVQTHLHRINWL